MFDSGAIVFSIRAAGAQVFEQDLKKADKAVEGFGNSSKTAADKTEELGKKQDKTTEQTRKHQKAQEDATRKAAEYADAQEKVGTVLVTAGAAIVATTALTVRSAIQWESAWAGVTKTVDGTAEELAEVEGGLRGLGSVLPASSNEIAAVAEAAGQLGVETPNVVAFTRTMIDLGETTNLSANDAATALARFMNVMGTSQDQVSNLGSSVVELGNNYATTEAEIVSMATRLSGAARQVGLTEGETLGLAAALSSVGIEAEAGGTAISKVMINIASAVDEGGESLTAFSDVAGVSAEDFAAQWKSDPGAAMATFVAGLADAESQGKSTFAVLEDLGITEQRMRDALLRAAAASDQFTTAMSTGNEAFEENNALQEEAAKRYETVEAQLGIMRNRINDAAIDLGSVFLPAVADAAGAIGDFADGFADLDPYLQEAVVVGGLLIGVVALVGGVALLAVPKIVAFRTAMATLTTQAPRLTGALGKTAAFLGGPWGIAIGVAVGGAMLLQKHIDSLKASSEEFQNVIQNASSAEDLFKIADQGTIISDLNKSIESAEKFQESLNTISTNDFARGMSISLSQLKTRLGEIGDELAATAQTDLPAAQEAFSLLADDMELSKDQQIQLLDSMPAYKAALVEQATQLGINVTSTDEAANSTELLELAQGDGVVQSESAARAYIDAADGASALSQDLDQLIETLNEANGVNQDAISANSDYQQTLSDVGDQIQNIKDGTEGYAAGLDLSTQAGRDNTQMLQDLAQDSQDAAQAQLDLDGNTQTYIQSLQDGRQKLIDSAIAMGASEEAAIDLADKIYKIPTQREVEILVETEEAQRRVNALRQAIDAVRSVNAIISATPGFQNADGNVIESYANGGVRENHVAQMARGGATRIWNEPETGGETYLPHALSKRARSEQLMMQTADIFGGTYIPAGARQFADGAVVADSGGDGGIRVVLQSKGGIDLLQYIEARVEQGSSNLNNALRGA